MHPRAAELIDTLGLKPHPEGGFFRELFRSEHAVAPADGRGSRAAITTIYFLLTRETFSRWHRVRSDEVWHLYEGGPLEVLEAELEARVLTRHCLGAVGEPDQAPVCTIATGRWQAARATSDYALAGCTVGPGFEYADFEMLAEDPVRAEALTKAWPEWAAML